MDSNQAITLINTIGVAACFGGSQEACDNAPYVIRCSPFQDYLSHKNLELCWRKVITAVDCPANSLSCLHKINHQVASLTYQHTLQNVSNNTADRPFLVVAGDHSSAIGTWSGVIQAMPTKTLGLIWIDAHLDSHTLDTSPSGNLHGMPLSVLLNKADKNLQATYPQLPLNQHTEYPYLLGENLSLLGARSYEPEELVLLNKANASIYSMQQLLHNTAPSQQLNNLAEDLLTRCDLIGISLDLDAISPEDAPAVETPEKDGIAGEMLISMLNNFTYKNKLVGFELSEFNPSNDIEQKTEKLILRLIAALFDK